MPGTARKLLVFGTLMYFISNLNSINADNNSAANSNAPRACYSCEGINCLRPSLLNATTACTTKWDTCVTIFEDYSVVAKGCFLDIPERYRRKCDHWDNLECSTCLGQLCNKLGRDDVRCLQCNSKQDPGCLRSSASDTKIVQCPQATTFNPFCYTRYDKNDVTRGCASTLREQKDCEHDVDCQLCYAGAGHGCNSHEHVAMVSAAVHMPLAHLSLIFAIIWAYLLK